MLTSTSSIGKTRNALMLMEEKMRKEDQSLFGTDTTERTNNGKSSMRRIRRKLPRKE
jgi:hypothetical protein